MHGAVDAGIISERATTAFVRSTRNRPLAGRHAHLHHRRADRHLLHLTRGDFAYSMRERSVGPIVQLMLKRLQASGALIATLFSTLPKRSHC